MRKNICEIIDIKYPIFQGAMAWIANASLASAVSNAGGLGIPGDTGAGADGVQRVRRKGTGSPGDTQSGDAGFV